jgi:hypothetical protein
MKRHDVRRDRDTRHVRDAGSLSRFSGSPPCNASSSPSGAKSGTAGKGGIRNFFWAAETAANGFVQRRD